MLSITSIRRGPHAPDETGDAQSAGLTVYGLILARPPEEREAAAARCMQLAEQVCKGSDGTLEAVLRIQQLLSAQLPEDRERLARHCVEWVEIVCGVVPFPFEPIQQRA